MCLCLLSARPVRPNPVHPSFEKVKGPSSPPCEARECFYCHKKGHVIADCLSLKNKHQLSPSLAQRNGMSLLKSVSVPDVNRSTDDNELDSCFKPFIQKGLVSLTGDPTTGNNAQRYGGSQSIILEGILPLSSASSCHSSAIVQGVGTPFVSALLHHVHLQSSLVSG